MFLKHSKSKNKIECSVGIYPAQALGEIAFDDDGHYDYLFLVEDKHAKALLGCMINFYLGVRNSSLPLPPYKIAPIGGYNQTLEFLKTTKQIIRDDVKRFVFLDKDVKDDVIKKAEAEKNYSFLAKIQETEKSTYYLPCIPEEGFVKLFESDPQLHSDQIKKLISQFPFDLIIVSYEESYLSAIKPKKKMKLILQRMADKTGKSEEYCMEILYSYYVQVEYGIDKSELKTVFGQVFSSK